ncbi:MAG: alpha/beta hydrolase family protein [Candidatus Promineifilaceae bacterium]
MRLLEIALIVTNIVVLFLPRANRRYAAMALIVLAVLHLFIEQSRWQMAPAYLIMALSALYFLFDLTAVRGWVGTLGAFLAIVLLLAAWGVGALFPVAQLAPLTGPHQVGSMTLQFVDQDRDEIYSAETDDKRRLVGTIWYPANVTNEPAAPFIPNADIGAKILANDFELPSFILTHVNLTKSRAYLNAPISDGTYPVVFFSHGLGGIRGQNTQMVEELVSQGYVVVAVDHAYAAAYTVFDDGEVVTYDRSILAWDTPREKETIQQLVRMWSGDLQFMLRELDRFNADATHPLGGHLQLDQVGAFGHSTGGGTAYEFCYREPRCAVAIGLDPWVLPTSDEAVADGLSKPLLILRNPEGLSEANVARLEALYAASAEQRGHWVVNGTGHYDYNDFKQLSRALTWIGLTGDISATDIRDLMDRSALTLFDAALRGGDGSDLARISAEYANIQPQD